MDLIDPDEYLELNKNGNTRKNEDMAFRQYERVMTCLSERGGETFEPLKEALAERLPYLLCKFLQAAKKSDGKVYAAGTINSIFNSMCNILSTREIEPVNVKSDVRFKKVREMLKVQTTKSAMEGRGTGCDAKRSVTKEHLGLALEAGTIGRNAPKPLSTSAYLGAVLGWGCRAGAECHMIQNDDLIFGPLSKKSGVPEWIELSERVTKTRNGNPGDERELIPRIFPDDEFPGSCYVRTVLEYQRRKTPSQRAPDAPFFLNVNPAAVKNPMQYQYWYVGTGKPGSGIMGIHMLESLLTGALEAAGVDCKLQKYSAISLRKSMLQSGVDCNVPDLHLSRLAGHKALVSKKSYINSAGVHHKTTGRVIHRQLFHGVNRGYDKEMRDVVAVDAESGAESSSSEDERGGSRKKTPANSAGVRVRRKVFSSREKRHTRERGRSREKRSSSMVRSETISRSRSLGRRQRRSRSRCKERRSISRCKERRSRSRCKERRSRSRCKERRSRSRLRDWREGRSKSKYRREQRSRDRKERRSSSRFRNKRDGRIRSRSMYRRERRSRDRKERRSRSRSRSISRIRTERRRSRDKKERISRSRTRSSSRVRRERRFRSRSIVGGSGRMKRRRTSRSGSSLGSRIRLRKLRSSSYSKKNRLGSLEDGKKTISPTNCLSGNEGNSVCEGRRRVSPSPLPGPSRAQWTTPSAEPDLSELSVEQYSKVS